MSAYYDTFDYPSYWKERSYEDLAEKQALRKLFEMVNDKTSIIDIGGGFGRLASLYSPIFKSCSIIEPSIKLIEIGRKDLKEFKNIKFVQGNLPKLPFKDEEFTCVLMNRVIHHIEDPTASLKEISKIIKKDGYFILEVANKVHFSAKIKHLLKGDFGFAKNLKPIERRSQVNIKEGSITFVNHHPANITKMLKENGFSIVSILSVSNFRSNFFKKLFPVKFLLFFEKYFSQLLSKVYFGPSIFILAKKSN